MVIFRLRDPQDTVLLILLLLLFYFITIIGFTYLSRVPGSIPGSVWDFAYWTITQLYVRSDCFFILVSFVRVLSCVVHGGAFCSFFTLSREGGVYAIVYVFLMFHRYSPIIGHWLLSLYQK